MDVAVAVGAAAAVVVAVGSAAATVVAGAAEEVVAAAAAAAVVPGAAALSEVMGVAPFPQPAAAAASTPSDRPSAGLTTERRTCVVPLGFAIAASYRQGAPRNSL